MHCDAPLDAFFVSFSRFYRSIFVIDCRLLSDRERRKKQIATVDCAYIFANRRSYNMLVWIVFFLLFFCCLMLSYSYFMLSFTHLFQLNDPHTHTHTY